MTTTMQPKTLSLAMAKKIANAIEAKAIEYQIKIAVAIIDSHGNLKYFQRMDDSSFISIRMSQLKAMTSASMPISTKALAERNSSMINSPYSSVPEFTFLEGGVPIITKDEQHIGAIGVSGAIAELNGACAQAGLDAIADEL